MREFTAMVENKWGGKQAVIVRAMDAADARGRLYRMGYAAVLWVL